MNFTRYILLLGIVALLVTGTAAGATLGISVDRPVNPNIADLVLATTPAPSYITCLQGYVCTIPADAQNKNYVMSNDTQPCGDFQGLPEYCYRAQLNTAAIAISKQVRPVSLGNPGTTMTTVVPVQLLPVESIRPLPAGIVTLIPISHRVGLVSINQSNVTPMTTNTGLIPVFIAHNGIFQSLNRFFFGSTCNGKTVDFQTDSANCGGCGWACPAGLTCVQGQCDMVCSKGLDTCEYNCVDLQTDTENCGKCGDICTAQQTCCYGKCADASGDTANCGMCGRSCGQDEKCTAGYCTGLCGNTCDATAEHCSNGVCTASLPSKFVEYDSTQYEDHTDYSAVATCPAADSQGCWIRMSSSRTRMGSVNYAGIYTSSELVTGYDHVELTVDTRNIPYAVKNGILSGTRKVYLVMHAASSDTGTSNAINRESSLWKIAYNTDTSHYTMYVTDIPGSDGSGGTETPPGQGAAVSGARAHYAGATGTVTVDITDIVKAWLNGSVQNNGLKLMPYSEFWPEPEDVDTSYGFTTYYDTLTVSSVSADAPL
jgi:hypothetical protein